MVTSLTSAYPKTSKEHSANYRLASKLVFRAKAPLRISFAGGGTDVPPHPEREGGCVLNATIDSFAWGSLRSRQDKKIKLESADLGICLTYDVDSEMELNGELDLAKGAIKRLAANNSHG